MTMFRDFFNDPVLYLSFGILGLTILLMGYYTWFFINKIMQSEDESKLH